MTAAESAALMRVRRRVGALGFFTVAIHGVLGLVGVAHVLVGQDRRDDATILIALSGVFALVTYAVVRAILDAPMWAPAWIALSLAPTVAAAFWIL